MTKKDLFRIIIKIFGLYLAIATLFSTIPNNISWAIQGFDVNGIIYTLLATGITLFLFITLVFNPDKIINWLKLDKGFDHDEIIIKQFSTDNILQLAIILIGGSLMIEYIPIFLSHSYFAFKTSAQNSFLSDYAYQYGEGRDYMKWGISFINLLIGYLLITKYKTISNRLTPKR